MTTPFTKRGIESVAPAPGKRLVIHDPVTPGLQVRITPSGQRAFYLRRRIDGRPERVRIGSYPAMTIEQARLRAADLNGAIARGANPAEAKRSVREEITFGAALEHLIRHKRNRAGKPLAARTIQEYRKAIATHAAPLLAEKLSRITLDRLKAVHRKIASPAQANKVKAVISAVWNHSIQEDLTGLPNPAAALRNRAIPARERFLQPGEMPRFFRAVAESPLADFFLLALSTGARRANIEAMRWQDLDLDRAAWTIPRTKNGLSQTLPLAPEAVAILERRKAERIHGAEFVFPGPGKTGHLVEPKRAFAAICRAAGIENLRIHDLRRTLGSWQARQGASLAVIGKSLGHKTHQATAIYARLDLDPVRQSVESATAAMLSAAGIREPAEIIALRPPGKRAKA